MVPVRPPREEEAAMAVIRFEPFRDQMAISSASSASSAPSVSETCQPTIMRENRSKINAA